MQTHLNNGSFYHRKPKLSAETSKVCFFGTQKVKVNVSSGNSFMALSSLAYFDEEFAVTETLGT